MKRTIYFTIIVLIGFTVAINGKMKLKLQSDLSNENSSTLGNHYLESDLKLELAP
jgi:hypothetical protein